MDLINPPLLILGPSTGPVGVGDHMIWLGIFTIKFLGMLGISLAILWLVGALD
jgi:hypothetical protein